MVHLRPIGSFLIIVFVLMLLNCGPKIKISQEMHDSGKYTVYKIDSINSYYLVYLTYRKNSFKVISKKESSSSCRLIKVGDQFNLFFLDRLIKEENYIPKDFKTISTLSFVPDCIKLDDSTEICRDRGMDNIYLSKSLRGLCYVDLAPKL
ncbi:hypothetical protein ACR1PO_17360 [Chryseobacterium sp. RRHN12]|uniref:hypothetical protein n=1 Tax=Chryseobacterium sp. RRHN12 TaxID=3437884 RepID=UPI003D9B0654